MNARIIIVMYNVRLSKILESVIEEVVSSLAKFCKNCLLRKRIIKSIKKSEEGSTGATPHSFFYYISLLPETDRRKPYFYPKTAFSDSP